MKTISARAAAFDLRVTRLLARDAYDNGGRTWALVFPASGPGRIVGAFRTRSDLVRYLEEKEGLFS